MKKGVSIAKKKEINSGERTEKSISSAGHMLLEKILKWQGSGT